MQSDRFSNFGVFGGFIFFSIVGMANPFFTLYAAELGASTFAIGAMVTLRAVLPIFIALPSGQMIDSIGPVRMLQVGSVALLASMLCTIFATGLVLLSLSQVFLGAAIIIMASSFQVLVSKGGDRDKRNDAIKRYAMWMSAGGMVGPVIGGLIISSAAVPLEGYRMAFVTSAAATLALMGAFVWIARHYPHPKIEEIEISPRDVMTMKGITQSYRSGISLAGQRAVQFGLTATFLIMYIQSLYISFLPLYLAQNDYATMLISVAIALKGLSGMLARFLLGYLMSRFSLESILTTAGVVAAGCVVLTPLAVSDPITMLALVALMGAAVGINLPVSIMIMVDAIGEGQRGKLMGLRLLVNRFAQILSPVMFGLVGQLLGLTAAFLGGGALLVGVLVGFATYVRRSTARAQTWRAPPKEPAE
ncbi:MAG: MFS transporter [Rhodobacteraceae bacterium]|nr:MFS transporter [Paracoccaceae bacterium]